MRFVSNPFVLGLIPLALAVAGCTGEATTDDAGGPVASQSLPTADTHDNHSHDHSSEGPHHGELIDLGNGEFHAELLLNKAAGTVTIYVLNAAATEQVPIEATEITINANHDGQPEQFTLSATPDADDPDGQCSRFVSKNKELAAHLDDEGADPQFVLTINGKSYRGRFSHGHGHAH